MASGVREERVQGHELKEAAEKLNAVSRVTITRLPPCRSARPKSLETATLFCYLLRGKEGGGWNQVAQQLIDHAGLPRM